MSYKHRVSGNQKGFPSLKGVVTMKRKDWLIMCYLRQNARAKISSISKQSGIPVSTIFDRIRFQEKRIITKHTCLIDFARIGYNTRAKLVLKANRKDREELKQFLLMNDNVNSLYKINNGFDFLAEIVFKYIRQMEDFLEQLEDKFTIKAKEIFYVIDDVKREGFLSNPISFEDHMRED
jgi:DNA-binding Lrp family transcriptional regulator